MAEKEHIECEALFRVIENIPDNELLGSDNTTFVELPTVLDIISEQPTADVIEKVDCEKCRHYSKTNSQYPCSHCSNCYTSKFEPMGN